MENGIFGFNDYKKYLRSLFAASEMRGKQARLAVALGCGTSFVSQVLNGSVHFSLEQGMKLNRFLNHTADESHYLMLLLHRGRAGSKDLIEYFDGQLKIESERRTNIEKRLRVKKSISSEEQMTYYSSWIYAAIHIIISIPGFQTVEAISKGLELTPAEVSQALDYLVEIGLATRSGSHFNIGANRIHLGKNSPMIAMHHANWRIRALNALSKKSRDSTHLSVVMGIAKADVEEVRSILLNAMEKIEEVISKSKEETLFCLGIDFFSSLSQ